MLGLIRTARRLREIGMMGIGQRNAELRAAIQQPAQVLSARRRQAHHQESGASKPACRCRSCMPWCARNMRSRSCMKSSRPYDQFVVKPAHGSGGDGILVITGRRGDKYRRSNGTS
jgi:hypothetical protein